MRICHATHYGSASETLSIQDMPMPELKKGMILIKVHASGVNAIDCEIRSGLLPVITQKKFPYTPGFDIAGTIVAFGPSTKKDSFKEGDYVYGMLPLEYGGGYAEYVLMHPQWLHHMPRNLNVVEAASLPLSYTAAFNCLHTNKSKNIVHKKSVLINGASGGIGTATVQLARVFGANDITAICSFSKWRMIKTLGAHDFIDYTDVSTYHHLRRKWDVIIDTCNTLDYHDMKLYLNPKGVYVSTENNVMNMRKALWNKIQKKNTYHIILTQPNHEILAHITKYIETWHIRPILDTNMPIESVVQAHERIESGKNIGKVSLTFDNNLVLL